MCIDSERLVNRYLTRCVSLIVIISEKEEHGTALLPSIRGGCSYVHAIAKHSRLQNEMK